jgi:transcriptional regulator with PAS, ATPase and Fis domain
MTVDTVTSPRGVASTGRVHRLLVVYAPEADQVGRTVLLASDRLLIGRFSSAEGLGLDDPEVSRAHAEIVRAEGGFVLRDLGSRNGTFVNGARLAREGDHELKGEDAIRFGSHLLLYQSLDEVDCQRLLDAMPKNDPAVGTSAAAARVRHAIQAAAPSALSVLIVGETGVGKELVAESVHAESGRTGPFVALDCASLPETLAESELFGHVGGAFTGAKARFGLFERARGGTLFLDEIGEMDFALQKKLLRVLSSGEARRVGADEGRRVDVRIVAATNADLEAMVKKGSFRGDLYARLAGHVIRVPPLRERRQDVLLLLRHFMRKRKVVATVGGDVAEALVVHRWPFNVRELEQLVGAIEPAVRFSRRMMLDALPPVFREALGARPLLVSDRGSTQYASVSIRRDVPPSKEELVLLLEMHHGNVSEVAAFFGRGRRQVYRWAERHQIDVKTARATLIPFARGRS